jgi:hypothetical protein
MSVVTQLYFQIVEENNYVVVFFNNLKIHTTGMMPPKIAPLMMMLQTHMTLIYDRRCIILATDSIIQ